jgi:putative metallohydrolase (TIGR04338 family)
MTKPRDNQRSKVYNAEQVIRRNGQAFTTVAECQAYTDKVLASPYVRRKWLKGTKMTATVLDGRGRRNANADWTLREIKLPKWARTEDVVLHEISHLLAPKFEQHGWQFCEIFLDLVRHFMGKDAHDKLKASFKQHRVRFSQPVKRTLTPEQKAALRERMARAREAREVTRCPSVVIVNPRADEDDPFQGYLRREGTQWHGCEYPYTSSLDDATVWQYPADARRAAEKSGYSRWEVVPMEEAERREREKELVAA